MGAQRQTGILAQHAGQWHDVFTADGLPRPQYTRILERMRSAGPRHLRSVEERVEATLREMGVSFDVRHDTVWRSKPWHCDILPHIFSIDEWDLICRGTVQRIEAFECFLSDIYGPRHILRAGLLPSAIVLGSSCFQPAASGLPLSHAARLHLCGLCLCRGESGRLEVRHHYFSNASGISYMIQNRRALARVDPGAFSVLPVQPIADTPLAILERLRDMAAGFESEPTVVLLTPGQGSPAYPEHSLLARRMGIPLVQGGDLLVLGDCVHLKTISGLERVEVIYTRVADPWIDPLVFRSDSLLGVPGLVHCIRKGTVCLVNTIGSQLADDRALLPFADKIIRYYLSQDPWLPTTRTRWLGDLDERILVLDSLAEFQIRPLYGERVLGRTRMQPPGRVEKERIAKEVLKTPGRFVAQPVRPMAWTTVVDGGKEIDVVHDHIVFALRGNEAIEVFPGALTRISANPGSFLTASELGGGSKDSRVPAGSPVAKSERPASLVPLREHVPPSKEITSRMAENCYWLGRYLERAYCLSYMLAAIETLETEELNAEERKLYRPMWNRLLPPLEGRSSDSRRAIGSWLERYRLATDVSEPGTVISTVLAALRNAGAVQDLLSPEAWAVFDELESVFKRIPSRKEPVRVQCMPVTRRLADHVTRLVPQFLGTMLATMLEDDAMRFCLIGVNFERAGIMANALESIAPALQAHFSKPHHSVHSSEIELSAILRLLGSRDAYRRIYQMRASPSEVLAVLCQHPENPRSIRRCMQACASLLEESLQDSVSTRETCVAPLRHFVDRISGIDWHYFSKDRPSTDTLPSWWFGFFPVAGRLPSTLGDLLSKIHIQTLDLHDVISDSFLSHQAQIRRESEPFLSGLD